MTALLSRPTQAFAAAGAAVVLALASGCGGGDSDGTDTGTTGGGATATATTGGGDETGGASATQGAQLFADTCSSCHQLEAAGSSGGIGPNLDELQPDAERVRQAIETGPGAMPAGLVEGQEADAVATYVAQSAGQ